VNDGSTDTTGMLCENYIAGNPLTVLHQQNQGVSAARNNGLKAANGKYIYFVDGDDLLAPMSIKSILEKIRLTDADIVSGEYVMFSNPNRIFLKNKMKKNNISRGAKSKIRHYSVVELIEKSMFLPNMSTSIIKKSLFEKNKIEFRVGTSNTEDLDCGMQLYLCARKIAVLEEPIYYYRQSRQGSLTNTRTRKSVEDSIEFINRWINRIASLPEDDIAKLWLLDYMAYQYSIAMGITYSCQKRERNDLLRQLADNKWLLDSRLSKKTKYVGIFYDIFGYKATSLMLSIVINKKKIYFRLSRLADLFNTVSIKDSVRIKYD
jgi:glycosyltransferase involved in cell wall biosynthesis